ncbi:MAG: type II secretion system GspH family protein [Acidobacteria bacterium]|nr:type II secretion system GspH family protein [Acidobacteriota bacterium]
MTQGNYDPAPFRTGDYFREFEALTRLLAKKMDALSARNRDLLVSTERRVQLLSSRLDGEVIPKWEMKEALDDILRHIRQASPQVPRPDKPDARSRSSGFTMIELLIVMTIILILSVIALPYFLEAKQRAHEAAAVGLLRSVNMAQIQYRFEKAEYTDSFDLLADFGMPDIDLGGGGGGGGQDTLLNSRYIFRLARPTPQQWSCTGEPVGARNTARYFFVDDSSVIRFNVGAYADASGKPL